MHHQSKIPIFAPQLMEEVSNELKVVYVLPWRSDHLTSDWIKSIENLCSPKYDAELIIVFHSFEEDPDQVVSDNLETYWKVESLKREMTKKGLIMHSINMIGLEQEWKNTALPYLIGMDEAFNRLNDTGNLNGIIATLRKDEQYDPHFTHEIIKSYEENSSLVAAESNWKYEADEDELPEDLFNSVIHHELRKKLDYQRLAKSGYPFPAMGNPSLFSIKGWIYNQLRPKLHNINELFQQMLHLAAINGGKIDQLSDLFVYPYCESSASLELRNLQKLYEQKLEETPVYANSTYKDLRQLIIYSPNFYYGHSLNDYQAIIRKLPQTVCAFLSDEHFFDHWKQMKSESRNQEQFKQRFFNWLSPSKVNSFLSFSANHFNQFSDLKKATSEFLSENHGIRTGMMDKEQLLRYFQNPEGKLKVVSRKHRA